MAVGLGLCATNKANSLRCFAGIGHTPAFTRVVWCAESAHLAGLNADDGNRRASEPYEDAAADSVLGSLAKRTIVVDRDHGIPGWRPLELNTGVDLVHGPASTILRDASHALGQIERRISPIQILALVTDASAQSG